MDSIGMEYKIKRIRARMTLKELSSELDMAIGLLSEFENDKYTLSPKHLERLESYWENKEAKNGQDC